MRSKFYPYQITHLFLHKQLQLPELSVHEQGNYIIFWWKSIVLGHLFLDPGAEWNESKFYSELVEAIRPAINHYSKNTAEVITSWEKTILIKDLEGFNNWMDSNFGFMTNVAIPSKAPVSVIICTCNRPAALSLCLRSLRSMICQPMEIIVVDNARTNNETETLVKSFPGVRYLEEKRPGLSHARNTGILNAKYDIIAFTDDDVKLHQNWVYRVWQTFDHAEIKAMTGLVLASELETETQYIFEKYWSFNRGYLHKIYDSTYFNKTLKQGPPVWKIGAGANMAFHKSIFNEVGLFDERLGAGASGCSEDSEIWYRILLKGYKIVYNPLAIAHHEHRKNAADLHKQLFSYMRGFAAAALIQQKQNKEAGYSRYLFSSLPRAYCRLLYRGFPFYNFRFRTILYEIKGVCSGLLFYLKNRDQAPYTGKSDSTS